MADKPFKRGKRLNPPLMSIAQKSPLRVQLVTAIRPEHMPNLARTEDGNVPVCEVIDLDTGEVALLIVPAVLQSMMERYKDMVGQKIELIDEGIAPGKNYRRVVVYELD